MKLPIVFPSLLRASAPAFLIATSLTASASALAQQELWFAYSDVDVDNFGRTHVGPDRDGDGIADLLVTCPEEDCVNVDEGVVHLYSTTGGELTKWCGDGQWGIQAMWVGDIDGGGLADFVVTQPGWYHPTVGQRTGRVQVISTESGAVIHEWAGTQWGGLFGHPIDVVGDMDGDGFGEVLVGAPSYGSSGEGKVWIFSTRTGAELRTHVGAVPYLNLGLVVRGLSDVDGDGACDYGITSTPASGNGRRVDVRSGRTGAILLRVNHTSTQMPGTDISPFVDLDGDGLDEVLIGGGSAAGYVEAISPISGKVLWHIDGNLTGDLFGFVVIGLSDLDGDGFNEVLVSAVNDSTRGRDDGCVNLISGRTLRPLYVFYAPLLYTDYYGVNLSRGSDFNGDGIEDLVIGNVFGGRNKWKGGFVGIYAGNDLWLQAEPQRPLVGDTVVVDLRGAEPNRLGLIALTDINGTPTFEALLVAPFDASGELQIDADIDPSVSGMDFTLMAWAQNRMGRGPLMDATPFLVSVQ